MRPHELTGNSDHSQDSPTSTPASPVAAHRRVVRISGIAGIVGAVMWTLGDILLIGANARPADYPLIFDTYADQIDTAKAAMMLTSTPARLAAGMLVANVGIVFYLAGSWHLSQGLMPAGRRWAWPIFGLLICGNAWAPLGHAVYYYLGMAYQTLLTTPADAHTALIDMADQFHLILQIAWSMPIITLGLALLGLGLRIALGNTAWPRWFAILANPLAVVGIGTLIGIISPEPVGTWLSGAAFNLGLMTIYTISTILLWSRRARAASAS